MCGRVQWFSFRSSIRWLIWEFDSAEEKSGQTERYFVNIKIFNLIWWRRRLTQMELKKKTFSISDDDFSVRHKIVHGVTMLSACRISMHRNEFCNRKRFDEGQWAVGNSPFNQMTRVASINVPKSNPHKQILCAPCCMSMTCTKRLQLTPLHAAWMNEWNEWQKESDVLVVSVLLGHAVGQL